MADDTLRKRALKAFADEFTATNRRADSDDDEAADFRFDYVSGYARGADDTLSAVLDALRAERDGTRMKNNAAANRRQALTQAIARIEKLKPTKGTT